MKKIEEAIKKCEQSHTIKSNAMKHDQILLIAKQIWVLVCFVMPRPLNRAFVLIMSGLELGLTPIQSVANIQIDNVKMTLALRSWQDFHSEARYSFKVLKILMIGVRWSSSIAIRRKYIHNGMTPGLRVLIRKTLGNDNLDCFLFERALTIGVKTFAAGVIGDLHR